MTNLLEGGVPMKITSHGHSCIEIELTDGTKLLIDPFITGNPLADVTAEEITADYILITHGHSDHIGDMVAIAKRNSAPVIVIAEIAGYAATKGLVSYGMNVGGQAEFPFGRVKFVQALHSSSYEIDGVLTYMGEACGIILEIENKKIYHAGDTALFSDMQLFKANQAIDVAFLPIGDNYTMGPADAQTAATLLAAKRTIPIHYNTFPAIQQDPEAFVEQITGGQVLQPGESTQV